MKVAIVSKDNFEEEVLKCEKKVLVDFNADWCGPCKMLKPVIEELSDIRDDVKFVSINIDDEEELAEKYNILSIPCLVLFKEGKEIKRNVGLVGKDDLEIFIGE